MRLLSGPAASPSTIRSRQFGHRVKGITMSSFKAEEIAALQAGGNEVSSCFTQAVYRCCHSPPRRTCVRAHGLAAQQQQR